ncbi:MAG: hydrogenase [Candidatus Angelobacter sp. Gp1-AA117]|nr:MAG: hydrogenase [Candidatus Angelobacter sp. Gp1-AA117]
MITDVMFHSLRSRSQLIPVEDLIRDCAGSRMPEIIPELLTAPIAAAAAEVCPTRAITTDTPVEGGCALRLDYGKCIGCGRCVEVGDGAIRPAKRFSHSGVSRSELVQTWQTGSGVEAQAGEMHTSARDRVYALLGRALNIRQLDPGSCNGCEAEITALTNPYYDLERFGIHFVASPKHADMLLITGPVTRNMATAVQKTYEAVPLPKLVVAVGACGCSGGIFDRRNCPVGTLVNLNEEIIGPVDSLLPVHGYIPGCPPTPAMLVSGILEVLNRYTGRK